MLFDYDKLFKISIGYFEKVYL
jgi:hypothetical protein